LGLSPLIDVILRRRKLPNSNRENAKERRQQRRKQPRTELSAKRRRARENPQKVERPGTPKTMTPPRAVSRKREN